MDPLAQTEDFKAERPRLGRLATRVLGDHAEAEDIDQQAWLRLHGTDTPTSSRDWTSPDGRFCRQRSDRAFRAELPEVCTVLDSQPETGRRMTPTIHGHVPR